MASFEDTIDYTNKKTKIYVAYFEYWDEITDSIKQYVKVYSTYSKATKEENGNAPYKIEEQYID